MSNETEGARIIADGVPVELKDGEHRLYIGMRQMEALEEMYDGLQPVMDQLKQGFEFKVPGVMKKFNDLFAIALSHEGLTRDEAVDLMNPKDLLTYFEKFIEVWNQAMPEADGNERPLARRTGTAGFRGRGSTTSRRSATAAATRRSAR